MMMGTKEKPEEIDTSNMDDFDKSCVDRWGEFMAWEFAYKHEHATKTATISFVLESSPIALLSWCVPGLAEQSCRQSSLTAGSEKSSSSGPTPIRQWTSSCPT